MVWNLLFWNLGLWYFGILKNKKKGKVGKREIREMAKCDDEKSEMEK